MPENPVSRAGHEPSATARHIGEHLALRLRDGEPPPIAAMQLLMQAESLAEAHAALLAAGKLKTSTGSLSRVADLIEANPTAWRTVRDIARSIEHRPVRGDALAHWAQVFDALVRRSPEGSVALYSLGNAQLLEEATAEISALLENWGLLDPRCVVLDIGCGIGRLEAALAPRVGSVTGIDISEAMLEEARRRCGDLPNVRFALGSGSDLAGTPDASVDLILLIDTFPYVVLSGAALTARLCAESARVLAPGGSLLILNARYGADADAELTELTRLAEAAGLDIHRADWRPLHSWDAPAFQLKRAARSRA